MEKRLEYFVKYERQDRVAIGVVKVDADGDASSKVIDGSDAALLLAATSAGRSTWDEDTICAVHGLIRKPVATVVPVAAVVPVIT